MRTILLAAALVSPLTVAASTASAEPLTTSASASSPATYELGLRIGGYGFRREGDTRPGVGWTECRMNGFGMFGTRAVRGPVFVEAGLDLYTSAEAAQATDLPIDRTSGLISTAIGARTNVTSWLRGYLQLGAGVELARVSVPYGDQRIRDNKAMPEGFFGAGMEVGYHGTYLGTTFRGLVMGNFDYDPQRLDMNNGWIEAPSSNEVFDASPGFAGQMQFYVRREL